MKKRRIPVGYIWDRAWAEKRSDLESDLEDFFIKASNLTRPDGTRLMKLAGLVKLEQEVIDEANNLLDELEKAYHSEGCEIPGYVAIFKDGDTSPTWT